MSNYRVLVSYDTERSVFVARAPELEHCSSEGATRTEALTKVEEEINAQLRNAREQGGRVPPALDDDTAAFAGEFTIKVSRTLHRDLVWQARSEGVELPQLLSEMLALGLELRRQRQRRPGPNSQPEVRGDAQGNQARPGDRGPRGQDRGGFRPGGGGRYHAIMEDRASFVEYVRGLDSGNGPRTNSGGGGGGGGGGGRRRGGGGGRGRFGGGGASSGGTGGGGTPPGDDDGRGNGP